MRPLTDERRFQLLRFLNRHQLRVRDLKPLDRALTHSSYAFEKQLDGNNERLEFLGDAVVGMFASRYLFDLYPGEPEGVLAKHKSSLVSGNVLGRRALELGLGPLLLVGRGEEQTGARQRARLLGSALEAVVGALFLESGAAVIEPFVKKVILEPCMALTRSAEYGDYKSQLQEYAQKIGTGSPVYEIVSVSGPDHDRQFEAVVLIDGGIQGCGKGSRKKIAENRAAMHAHMVLLKKLEPPD
ncbi:MAG: ribonuclease III [bacterium]|nr:ribonuclease III [Candidatus Sumerlaeota bacterium]